jgi:hypothetical protein
MLLRRIAVAGIALLLAASVVCAQDAAAPDDGQKADKPDAIVELFSVRSFAVPRKFSIADDARVDRPDVRPEERRRDDGQTWVFANPVDGLAGPTIGQVDIRDQARNYVKQRIVSEILSKTAFGRGLSVFVDTGKDGVDPTRSRLLPFISPKVSAREGGRAAITFTWKF